MCTATDGAAKISRKGAKYPNGTVFGHELYAAKRRRRCTGEGARTANGQRQAGNEQWARRWLGCRSVNARRTATLGLSAYLADGRKRGPDRALPQLPLEQHQRCQDYVAGYALRFEEVAHGCFPQGAARGLFSARRLLACWAIIAR